MQTHTSHRQDILAETKLFRSLNAEQNYTVSTIVREQRFSIGQTIFEQEDPGDCLYIIVDGYVRIFLLSPDGREITFRVYGRGDTFGEFAVLDGKPRSAGAIALNNVTTLVIYRNEFRELLRSNFDLVERTLEELAERLRFTTRFGQNLVFLDAAGRIAAALAELMVRQGDYSAPVRLTLTQHALASYAGVTREWTNKALREFAQDGLVRVERGAVIVLEPTRLLHWSDA